jgi:hypothetical protein
VQRVTSLFKTKAALPAMSNLSDLFRSLPKPTNEVSLAATFAGIAIPKTEHHVGKDSRGRPAILLRVAPAAVRPPSIVLQNLRVEHGLHCRISTSDGVLEDQFSLIHCQSEDGLLQECFFDLADAILRSLPRTPNAAELSEAVEHIAALFLALDRPATRSAQGLWGELFLIANAKRPLIAAESWHTEACERYDFALALDRLEVKTSSDRTRNHHFSFEQVYPVGGLRVVIASLFVEKSAAGIKLGDLWDTARSAVTANPELRLKIDEICLRSLGSAWSEARSFGFDEQLARQSLAFYDVRDVRRVPNSPPAGVTEIRFRSDVSLGRTISEAQRPLGRLLNALVGEA